MALVGNALAGASAVGAQRTPVRFSLILHCFSNYYTTLYHLVGNDLAGASAVGAQRTPVTPQPAGSGAKPTIYYTTLLLY